MRNSGQKTSFFPLDFMFHLTKKEVDVLLSQNVIPSKKSLGGYNPYAFTEQGVAMLSSVLRSKRAVEVNIAIISLCVFVVNLTHKAREIVHH